MTTLARARLTARTEIEICTESLGGSTLARAALAGSLPEDWYPRCPATRDAWRNRIAEVRAHAASVWHERLTPAFAAQGAAAERLARSAAGAGVVITTGQQPGLFGGPLYTWFKALSALTLADTLEEATGIPVAPVFWAATDDADFVEAADTWVVTPDGALRIALPSRDTGGRPLADVPLGDVDEQLDALARACGSAAHADVLALARRAYAPGTTIGAAYLTLLRALLEPLGIAVLDASHPAVRETGDGLLRRALRDAPALERAVRGRAVEIEVAGFVPQVTPVDGLSLVFSRDAAGGKVRVPLAEAARVAEDASATLGATVLVRPVMERAILPTAAYVAGPGELAYFAQVSAVADALGAARPLAVPRWSATVIEPHVRRTMQRLGARDDALNDPHAAERELATALLPPEVVTALASLRAGVERGAAALRDAGASLVPDAVVDGFLRQQSARVDRLERRYRAAMRRHDAQLFRDLASVRAALRPGGARQERALNLLPSLARHGPALLADLRDAARVHAERLIGDSDASSRSEGRAEVAGA